MKARIGVWCPNEKHWNWGLKPLQTQHDANKNQELVKQLYDALRKMGVHKAYAPNVASSSAIIIDGGELKEQIDLGTGVRLHRNSTVPADGIFLKKGQAFVMSSAGCPVIIATASNHMIVAHAGRDSLIDPGVLMREPTRTHLSVVYAIVKAFGVRPSEIEMRMLFSIPEKAFRHDVNHWMYGEQNRRLAAFIGTWCPDGVSKENGSIFLNLEKIFLAQARMIGVQNATATHSLNQFPAMAHTRDGEDVRRRNLVVVKHL
ncbi:hypothetical protein A2609_03565 [Candidatus Kaiserbacteria bacterium RIFOXYD1_FULL_47_14]|uniref:Uncharacterized protein n=1 Tax=Candidatus Kaiserbacteria bacterium RIFOXYD1_FULL_47_14 TaxID=1798533 RepID=A0A1F6G499_9BACT|nr:MAG: hypothetical protein A2609_03565 [Candidatus Kaiserbacteria bacterium RIFOXYD1_FULL_47_14]